jgi:uncharacterized protein
MFFLVVFTLWFAFHVYAAWRLTGPFSRTSPKVRAARLLIAAMAIVPLLTTFLERWRVDYPGRSTATYLGFASAGFACDAPRFVVAIGAFLRKRLRGGGGGDSAARPTTIENDAPQNPARRGFLVRATNIGVLATSTGGFGVGLKEGRALPETKETDVPVRNLPPALDGFRIVQLSDVHIGPIHDAAYLSAIVDRVNELEADLVAITGDLVDGFVDDLRDATNSLARLRARHGSWFVTGNHEFYWDADAWCAEMRRLGIVVLENEHRVLEHDGAKLVLGGVHDFSATRREGSRSDPTLAFKDAPEGLPRVLLAHQPKSVFKAARAHADVQLSGHTHGGQFFPFTLLIGFFQRYVAGLYEHRPKGEGSPVALYVHRGSGSWGPPLRLGSPKEIAVLKLRPAASA